MWAVTATPTIVRPAVFKTSTTRLCFIATIFLGLAFLFFGIILIPVLPHFQLDVVLTQEQLKDDTLRESTLAMLKKASGIQWLIWTIGGAAQLTIGVIGLLANKVRGGHVSDGS